MCSQNPKTNNEAFYKKIKKNKVYTIIEVKLKTQK